MKYVFNYKIFLSREFKSKHRLKIRWKNHWEESQEEAMCFNFKSYMYLFFR